MPNSEIDCPTIEMYPGLKNIYYSILMVSHIVELNGLKIIMRNFVRTIYDLGQCAIKAAKDIRIIMLRRCLFIQHVAHKSNDVNNEAAKASKRIGGTILLVHTRDSVCSNVPFTLECYIYG